MNQRSSLNQPFLAVYCIFFLLLTKSGIGQQPLNQRTSSPPKILPPKIISLINNSIPQHAVTMKTYPKRDTLLSPGEWLPGIRRQVPQGYQTIQAAINACNNGDTVLVADGLYIENIRFRGKAIVVSSLYLIDGDTSHISQTIIDGSNPSHPDSGSVVYFIDGEDTTSALCGFTVQGGTGTPYFWNGFGWFRIGGGIFCSSSTARISRNIIKNNSVNASMASGGGCSVINFDPVNAWFILDENYISANQVRSFSGEANSGGVELAGTSAIITGNRIEANTVSGNTYAYGGGVSLYSISTLGPYPRAIIRENLLLNNHIYGSLHGAIGAGMMLILTADVSIEDNIFQDNLAISISGSANGGGLNISDEFGAGLGLKQLARNRFINNQVNGLAGWGVGGGIMLVNTTVLLQENDIINSRAEGGEGGSGGAIYISGSSFSIHENLVSGNFSQTNGGGIEVAEPPAEGSEQLITNNTLIGNFTNFSGGALNIYNIDSIIVKNNLIRNNTALNETGGGIVIGGANFRARFENNMITNNSARFGGGIGTWGTGVLQAINNTIVGNNATEDGGGMVIWDNVSPMLMNNILWDNFLGSTLNQLSPNQSPPGQYFYNNIQGGWPGSRNINVNPLFADSLYHLSDSSYCISLGKRKIISGGTVYYAPSTDFEGDLRPNPIDTLVDIGADESPFSAWAQPQYSIINGNQSYIHPYLDSLRIGLKLFNPHQQTVSLFTRIYNQQGVLLDEVLLFDDGLHGDSAAGDLFYGAVLPPLGMEETCRFNHQIIYHSIQKSLIFPENKKITSSGPVNCTGYRAYPSASNWFMLRLTLRNQGQTATAENIRAELLPLDSWINRIIDNNQSFGNIAPGDTAVNANPYFIDIDTLNYPGYITLGLRINSNGYPYWSYQDIIIGVEDASPAPPKQFALFANYPNPFNPKTVISWQLGVGGDVKLEVYNLRGQRVASLIHQRLPAGPHSIEFDASNLASGVYFYRLEAGAHVETRKMVVLK